MVTEIILISIPFHFWSQNIFFERVSDAPKNNEEKKRVAKEKKNKEKNAMNVKDKKKLVKTKTK
jgi:hypothetical protein